ncbi:16S rRNA (cytosine(1402)-N(4))-methyltransferase RsmH [Magnetospirillum fulvum]|uniref:Ribosomal RNA small subunit methyltransferase H n=1 Tax=Magnetospirillum fulvum MGU-K5 TaxID=1316936 RepID=S9SE16_MAGFU|nr:16S rRNA (cytosine(1402)-N(4))-methyltransferase RsmH [Magnetospirillum fulvum]EPY02979.1 16S rRNA m(4)C1402 methyltransferase [Magnetospirillum fulvum MGU-K5]
MSAAAPHLPVLLAEVIAAIDPRDGGRYLDGTFGAGGYCRAILAAAPGCHLSGIDRDPTAAARGQALEAENPGRFTFVPGRFGEMASLLGEDAIGTLDGIVLDIGVSSMQIDEAERGFSFSKDGPLDMRMERSGPDAADIVNTTPEADLANILYRYGEERLSRRIARAIVEARKEQPFRRTGELATLVRKVVPRHPDGIDPATRTFQALRIAVNDELGELERGLAAAESLLAPGGRLVVVTFHSLEDRIVKDFLRDRSGAAALPSRHLPHGGAGPRPSFTLIQRRAVRPGEDELARNPRARSARLRAAARTEAPAWPQTTGRAA